MFKSAATKIAHNSTLPALALSGNKDLRPLQDLITAEKVVLVSCAIFVGVPGKLTELGVSQTTET
jgi:hypothetical protein